VTVRGVIDLSAGVLRGCHILGGWSSWGRRYPEAVIRKARRLYEGRPVYFGHEGGWRHEPLAHVRNPRVVDGRLYGDLRLNRFNPDEARALVRLALTEDRVGLSHYADCVGVKEDGVEIVQEIRRVLSVDVVRQGATTRGLFESGFKVRGEGSPMARKWLGGAEYATTSLFGDGRPARIMESRRRLREWKDDNEDQQDFMDDDDGEDGDRGDDDQARRAADLAERVKSIVSASVSGHPVTRSDWDTLNAVVGFLLEIGKPGKVGVEESRRAFARIALKQAKPGDKRKALTETRKRSTRQVNSGKAFAEALRERSR
jgi:hypothetical protein